MDVPAEKQLSKSQKKKAKRKQKGEQKGAAEPAFEIEEVTEGVASVSLSNAEPPKQLSSTPPTGKLPELTHLLLLVQEQLLN